MLLSGCFLGGGGGDAKPKKPVYPHYINIQGDLTVNGRYYVRGNLSDCAGAGPFADIVRGAPVLVSDQVGRPLAVGRVAYGVGTNVYQNRLDQCVFRFRVPNVKRAPVYQIRVARQQPVFRSFYILWRYGGSTGFALPLPTTTTTTTIPLSALLGNG
jgi:hypothetical protein